MIFQLLAFVYFITTAFSSPINPYLVCEGKKWQTIFTFFTTNYIAHALTIIPDPGANLFAQSVFSLSALTVPPGHHTFITYNGTKTAASLSMDIGIKALYAPPWGPPSARSPTPLAQSF